jgi:hypothetical protein
MTTLKTAAKTILTFVLGFLTLLTGCSRPANAMVDPARAFKDPRVVALCKAAQRIYPPSVECKVQP